MQMLVEENSLPNLVSSRDAVLWCSLCMTSNGPGGEGGDEWLEMPHLANSTRQPLLTLQSPCRTCTCCHAALPNREHMFSLRTNRGYSVHRKPHLLAIPLMGIMEVSFLHYSVPLYVFSGHWVQLQYRSDTWGQGSSYWLDKKITL